MSALVAAARSYLGVPWLHCGRTRKGLDCAGLMVRAYADCGVAVPDRRRYGRDPFANGLQEAVVEALGAPIWQGDKGRVVCGMLEIGDVVVMSPAGRPRHLAMVGDGEYGFCLVHADCTPGVMQVCQIELMPFHLRQIVAIFRRPVA